MRFFPATRHARFVGLQFERQRSTRPTLCSGNKALLCLLFYVTGFFTGAILIGDLLLAMHAS